MLISYTELVRDIVGAGVIEGVETLDNVNGSSIDITLGKDLLVEESPKVKCPNCGWDLAFTQYMVVRPMSNIWHECTHCMNGSSLAEWITPVDFSKKEPIITRKVDCTDGYVLYPGEVCLAHSVEKFHLPSHITAEYRLKSSMGRVFFEHLHAGWADPGWHGSVLTLEFVNMSQRHPILLTAGIKCGQVCFYRHEPVPEDRSYAVRGQYNNDETATESKGMK